MSAPYLMDEPSRADTDAASGPMILEFGSNGCGHCRRAQPFIEAALEARAMNAHAPMPHIKVQDGPGKPLGRSFRVKLWPTLIFLRDGKEVARVVRPTDTAALVEALHRIDPV